MPALSTPLWVALHLPALSLEAWAAGGPADGRPGALIADHVVQQADAAALALGVRPGMQRATALALASDLRLGQADAARDARALRAVAHVALGFSPSVTWLPVAGADDPSPLEPLATLYRHLDPDDLEDADALLAEIETLAPPESLDEAVEDLVRSVLLIADVSRPQEAPPRPAPGRPRAGAGAGRPGRPAGPGGAGGPPGPARKTPHRRPG